MAPTAAYVRSRPPRPPQLLGFTLPYSIPPVSRDRDAVAPRAGTCPEGIAWFDIATDTDTAHAIAECSNMVGHGRRPGSELVASCALTAASLQGSCDRGTGTCSCQAPFTGEACEKSAPALCSGPRGASADPARVPRGAVDCPNACNGHGVCMSLEDAAAERDDLNLLSIVQYDSVWDANKIYGCVCDDGWTGFDCSRRCDPLLPPPPRRP